MSTKQRFGSLMVLLLLGTPARADVTLPAIFSDHMVLPAANAVPVWGWANPQEQVSVSIQQQTKTTTADANGHWQVTLDKPTPGTTTTLTVKGKNSVTIQDVLVGDVWLCAGDSLMSKSVESTRPARGELSNKAFPPIRLFRITTTPAREPATNLSGSWVVVERSTIGNFPAVAFLFAKALHEQTQRPIGIIEACDPTPVSIQRGGKVLGSTVEAWISEPTLRSIPTAKPIFDYQDSAIALRDALAEYENALGDWKPRTGKAFGAELAELEKREPDVWYDYVAEMRKAGKPAPTDPPRKPTAESLRLAATRTANLFNGMIAPLSAFALRGVALSIGTANAPRATQYCTLFPALIRDWRRTFGRDDLPFVFLQQSRAAHPNMDPRAIAELREAQAFVANMPHTEMVRTIDLGGNIVPDDILTLARRMAVAAHAVTPAVRASATGPMIEKVSFEAGQAIVQFRAGQGPLAIRSGDKLKGFALTERPNRWAYADAKIDGDRVVVSHPKLKAPVALRYDWVVESNWEGNLTDASGLPALPFRSDDWPAFTDTSAALKPNAVATIVPADLYPVPDPTLPRVLLIGDSIMNGYSPFVIETLRGKVNVVRMVAFGMIGQKDAAAATFAAKLKDGDYALIHYNDGLHSLPPRITDEQFAEGLTAMLKHLKTVCPHVIWATTTPAPDRNNSLGPESHNGTVITRNEISKRIAAEHKVPVIDLYGLVIGERETLQGFANLHFTPEGSKRMGQKIAAEILSTLQQPAAPPASPVK